MTTPASSIIPRPQSIETLPGQCRLDADTRLEITGADEDNRRRLRDAFVAATGLPLTGQGAAIAIHIDAADPANLGREGYRLHIRPDGVRIEAAAANGAYYACQSIRQLLPVADFDPARAGGQVREIPCATIEDRPRFPWRGLMLDCGRYFMPVETVKRFIDLLALHKLNTFHWHLTEDQGWRLEIRKYPRLTEIGAWRKQTLIGRPTKEPPQLDGKPHGGFYSQDEVRDIVVYAADRFVTVVPEIEMPGHSRAAIAAYPELGSVDYPIEVGEIWGVGDGENTVNADDATIRFFQDVLEETLELFPSQFIHIGGDEAHKGHWKNNPRIQARIRELGLKDEDALQAWFIGRIDDFLTARGRRLIGWDEILEGGLAEGATVMSWRGFEGGIAAAKAGHDVVMAPTKFTYFDFYQADPGTEPLAIGGLLPLRQAYEFEPIAPELTDAEAARVLGGQGQLWTEYISNQNQLDYMTFPRACALAETLWSPRDARDYADFRRRLSPHLQRLDTFAVAYRRPTDEE